MKSCCNMSILLNHNIEYFLNESCSDDDVDYESEDSVTVNKLKMWWLRLLYKKVLL